MFARLAIEVRFQYEVLVLTVCLLRAWYRVSKKHSDRAKHKINTVRDGVMNKWVGDVSDTLARRVQYYKRRDIRLYKLAMGTQGRMA